MNQGPLSERPAPSQRKSGTLRLFPPGEPVQEALPADPAAYALFRMCRGFIDDLNRMLPIRTRIHLEGEIAHGRSQGKVDGPKASFRWEFMEHGASPTVPRAAQIL
ncbi:MAG: hypothetical protein JWP91_914 [Fibrobacteres bacterium]|nr:hypothetical protein [Fibrobacterota bacterium]